MSKRVLGVSLAVVAMSALAAAGLVAQDRGRAPQNDPDKKEWLQLFNGRDLNDWTIKFAHHDLGENVNDTFRVEDGLLKVRYDKWTTFDREFGHIFYKQPFSYYLLAAEYRFVGEQVKAAGPSLSWAIRNNGLMLHSQAPETMGTDQDFPISVEMQLLGGLPNGKPRSTANMCSPGTQVFINDVMVKGHCLNSKSQTYAGDVWVRVEVEVRGGERITHRIDGQTVLEYERPTIGGGEVNGFDPAIKVDGKLLTEGYIAIQAESHPTEFRKIELRNLAGK